MKTEFIVKRGERPFLINQEGHGKPINLELTDFKNIELLKDLCKRGYVGFVDGKAFMKHYDAVANCADKNCNKVYLRSEGKHGFCPNCLEKINKLIRK